MNKNNFYEIELNENEINQANFDNFFNNLKNNHDIFLKAIEKENERYKKNNQKKK